MQQKQCRLININVKLSKMLHCESKCTSTLGFHCCSLRATTVRYGRNKFERDTESDACRPGVSR